MLKFKYLLLTLLSFTLLKSEAQTDAKLYQVSSISALMKGYFDSGFRFKDVLRHGDFGLGTFNHLNGEMVCMDGQVYQITYDGMVNKIADTTQTPFAAITRFKPQIKFNSTQHLDFHQLENLIDSLIPTKNLIVAVKLSGKFKTIKARSVKPQTKPYPLLVKAVKDQSVFGFCEISGNLIGFRFPEVMDGVNVPGFHLHFLSSDKKSGGHLISCEIEDAKIEIELISGFEVLLPTDKTFYDLDLKKSDQSDLNKVEKQ